MSIIDVKVPQLSESVTEATILNCKKKLGEFVSQDEILMEIETDKVILEIPSPANGLLIEFTKQNGDYIVSNEIIAKIDTKLNTEVIITESENTTNSKKIDTELLISKDDQHTTASPAANKIITEQGLSISEMHGTGRSGRITKNDVQKIMVSNYQQFPDKKITSQTLITNEKDKKAIINNRCEKRVPMSRLRARIAERLVQSQHTNAILTTFNEVNMRQIIELREKYKNLFEKEYNVKLGFMSFFVKAAIHALKQYPIINASVDDNDIIYHNYFDIGIAISSPRGLVVPILRNADQLSISSIEKTICKFRQKAIDGKLSLDDLNGGTFSISNGGIFGSMLSTPIINPPQSAILGIHATKERVIVENGNIVIRPINYLAMSYDHRIIDGREAVLALGKIKNAIEDPYCLLLDL